MRKLLPVLTIFLSFLQNGMAQMQVTASNTTPFTPENLISNVFLGGGVEVKSIKFDGDPEAVGYFSTALNAVGIERGILLTSGHVETGGGSIGADKTGTDFASTNNNSNAFDTDLQNATTQPIKDVAVYTIEFVPISDTLRFKYVFASEEYPEYACTAFNDVFGFFISGPNPSGGFYNAKNIAIVPGTSQTVTISNVHPLNPSNGCPAKNGQYYNNNDGSAKQPVYDGYLDVFTAEAVVIPCNTYTIKLAIADAGDEIFDTGVFLEAKSFGTGSLDVSFSTVSSDGTITEGCAPGLLSFKLPFAVKDSFKIDYTIFGSATNGVDYNAIPSNLAIPKGDSVLQIPIVALEDGLAESGEFIAVDVRRDVCNRDTFYIYLRDNNLVGPNLPTDTTICLGQSVLLDGTLPVPLPTPPMFTNDQDITINPINTAIFSPLNVFGVQPSNLGPGVIKSVCVDISHVEIDDIDLFLVAPDGRFMELSTDNGKNSNNMEVCFTPVATIPAQYINDSLKVLFPPNGNVPGADMNTYFKGEWAPEGFWADLWDGGSPTNGTWKLLMRDDFQGFIGQLNKWSITFEPSYKINYEWSPNAELTCTKCPITVATPSLSRLYNFKATDSYGCVVQDSVQINVLNELPAPEVFCASQNANSISFSWLDVPGATGFEVNINNTGWQPANGTLSHLVSGLAPSSSVTIQVRALGSCVAAISTHTCVNCDAPSVNFSTTPASCFGKMDGAVSFFATGSNPPFDFQIPSDLNQTGQFNGLAAGIFIATVTDASGCATNLPVEITQPTATKATISILQNASCFEKMDGSASVLTSGGTAPFTFLWNDPAAQTGQTAFNLAAGNLQVTITDSHGCSASDDAQVVEPQPISVAVTSSPAACNATPTGSATASPSGGTAPFSFSWNDPTNQKTQTATSLAAGNFTVIATDANGCTGVGSVVVSEPSPLVATFAVEPTKCSNTSDGSAIVSPSGGTPFSPPSAYKYNWSGLPAQLDSTATGLQAISYSVTVTDAAGCSILVPLSISSPPAVIVSLSAKATKCFDSKDGELTASPSGGSGSGYTFLWNTTPAQTTATATNLSKGIYSVTVTDSNGCTMNATGQVVSPAQIVAAPTIVDASCFGAADGSISLSLTGGQTPFSFLWNGGQLTNSIQNQLANKYSVVVTDANNCSVSLTSLEIKQPTELQILSSKTDVACFNGSDGKIEIMPSGGSPSYAFSWSGLNGFQSQNQNLTGLAAGNFDLVLTDSHGCSLQKSIALSQPATAVSANLPPISDIICFGETSGEATVLANGGTSPYSFLWSNGTTTASISGLAVGNFSVTVSDAAACTTTATTQIEEKAEIHANISITQALCSNGTNGAAAITQIFYGNQPASLADFIFKWSTTPPQFGPSAANLTAGQTYQVTMSDASGCLTVQMILLQNPSAMTAQIDSFSNVKCFEGSDGWASASATGGKTPYTFQWSQNTGNQQVMRAIGLPIGTFSVTITDANGCFATAQTTLTQPEKLTMEFQKVDVKCFGETTGKANVKPLGGFGPFEFSWSNGSKTERADDLAAGPFFCTLTDAHGCSATDLIEILQPVAPLEATAERFAPHCAGGHDGSIEITATGGTSPYKYGLDGVHFNGSSIQIGLFAGNYTAFVKDFNGCQTSVGGLEIKDRSPLEIELGPDFSINLGQSFALNLTIKNAVGPVEIVWDAADTTFLSCSNCPNPSVDSLFYQHTFTVFVIDSAGCSATDFITVTVEKPRRVFVPTGFSPNGDLQNDLLLIHGQSGVLIHTFRIYDRWGELVFQAENFPINDENVGWNGQFRGDDCPAGVFIWTLEVEYIDHVREFLKGQTVLIR